MRTFCPNERIKRGGLLAVVLWSLCLSGCTTLFFASYPPLPRNAVPPVVAVSSFENRSGFAGQWELGGGMADLLASELIETRNFTVVERGRLDNVVDELQRQKHRMFRDEGKVDEGRLKNARYLIRGVVNDFSQTGGGSFGIAIRKVVTLGRGGYRARVALTLTLVDVESGEIVDSVQCAAEARAGEAYVSVNYKNVSFGGDAFFRTPLGAATAAAIRSGVMKILERVPRGYWEPMIAAVEGEVVIVNGGLNRGFREGQVYEVRGAGRRITDPATGDLLSVVPGPAMGQIRIHQVDKDIAWAMPVKGKGFERGQHLSPSPGKVSP